MAATGATAALVYFLAIGGTPTGELLGSLRVVNTAVAAAFVIYYLLKAPLRMDLIDRLVLAALLLFALSAIASRFPRQAVDALLAALTYTALFYAARGFMESRFGSTALLWAMRAMSLVVVFVAASRSLPAAVEWWQLTGDPPPVGLPIVARPWGHSYDLVMLGIMLTPSWFTSPTARARVISGVGVALVLGAIVVMQGARALWLAVALATAVVFILYLVGYAGGIPRRVAGVAIALAATVGLMVIALGGPIVDRLLTSATVGQRLEMWTASVEAWIQRPVFGFGPGSFPWILQSTDYFKTNSIHPRHPDSAIFQLLPELGLVGIAAAVIVLATIGVSLARRRQYLALWPLAAFVAAGLGANPTDFSYLVVVAILWAAYGLPRLVESRAVSPSAWLRPAMAAGLVVVGAFEVVTLAAGLSYDAANRAAAHGDVAAARQRLDTAVALDPGMAIYVRQRGISSLLLGDGQAAETDLAQAVRLNANDDLSWRALAIARSTNDDVQGASEALRHALALQRSDQSSLLLLASWQADARDVAGLSGTASEIVLAWPAVIAAPGWAEMTSDLDPASIVDAALDRWQEGLPSPEPLRQQPLILAAIADRLDLVASANELTNESGRLASAAVAVIQCDPGSGELLRRIPDSDRRSSTYWALRLQEASRQGTPDRDALELYRLITATEPSTEDWAEPMNPLRENNAQGSVDAWGYDRVPIAWTRSPIELPLPYAGSRRWLLDPDGAREAARLDIGGCG